MRLSAERPREALACDEALLSQVRADGPPLVRWYVVDAPAVVVGLGLRHRIAEVVDLDRCRGANVEVLERAAGGGAVLLDEHMLCCAICLPIEHPLVSSDLTESYRWLGDHFAARLRTLGIPSRRVEVAEARADVADLHASAEPVSALLLTTCYGALSPHEVITETRAKVAGFAQVRRRHAALFQVGILLQDQSRLADFVNVSDEPTREAFRSALERRTAGLEGRVGDLEEALLLLQTDQLL